MNDHPWSRLRHRSYLSQFDGLDASVEVIELAPHVHPAGRFGQGASFVEPVKGGEAVRMSRAMEVSEVLGRTLALSVG